MKSSNGLACASPVSLRPPPGEESELRHEDIGFGGERRRAHHGVYLTDVRRESAAPAIPPWAEPAEITAGEMPGRYRISCACTLETPGETS